MQILADARRELDANERLLANIKASQRKLDATLNRAAWNPSTANSDSLEVRLGIRQEDGMVWALHTQPAYFVLRDTAGGVVLDCVSRLTWTKVPYAGTPLWRVENLTDDWRPMDGSMKVAVGDDFTITGLNMKLNA